MKLKLWLLLLFLCAVIIPAQLKNKKHEEHDKNSERNRGGQHGKHGKPGHGHGHGHGHGPPGKRGKGRLEDLKAEFDTSDDSDDDDDANDWLFDLQSLKVTSLLFSDGSLLARRRDLSLT